MKRASDRANIAATVLLGLLCLSLWWAMNRPMAEPPWPSVISGISFSPMRADHDPANPIYPSIDEIDEDLALLAGNVHAVRTYSVKSVLGEIPRLASEHGLNVAVGAWLNDDQDANKREVDRAIEIYREHHANIVRVVVGNEAILREEQTVAQVIAHVRRVKEEVWAPVSTAEPWHIWLDHPELVAQVDFIAVHVLPYWEGIGIDDAIRHVQRRYRELQQAYPTKPIVITEVGWPSHGRTRQRSVASAANQATFLRRFLAMAEREDMTYYLLEAFDQPWKRRIEGDVGAHWGVFSAQREQKFEFTSPVVPVADWKTLSVATIGLAALILLLLFRDSRGLSPAGRGFLAAIAYATATFVVWLLYDLTRQYLTPAMLTAAVMLTVLAVGVIVVLLAEAHEWAEALCLKRSRRQPSPLQPGSGKLPKVSIHVPAYDEPPAMLKQTLDALAGLDYPDFEVLVIDNNTPDPNVWRPVEAHCAQLGPRFRFFHVSPLDGFKAGALNYALKATAADADIVAVIDSDYVVEPNWLRDLAPLFNDARLAIVQAPQDYRDGHRSAFKAMMQAEYQGFFQIGMITRNERDAIIQHGTMTMVRRSALDEVGGWREWCITEDAELGLRLFEAGYSAIYVPHSYGRGLMPDTFVDFKQQRFRWAYGAVTIMRRHFADLFGLRKTSLTPGQRYHFVAGWLPWLADGFNLVINLAALAWTAGMVLAPQVFAPPSIIFAVLPLTLFVFRLTKLMFLYRSRVGARLRQSLAAGVAGLALSHGIARAMLTGLCSRKVAFFRTPKRADTQGAVRALLDAREEMLFFIAMVLGAIAVAQRPDGDMLDVRVWCLMLAVQAVPYAAAGLVSLVSATPRLSGRWIGEMRRMLVRDPG